MRDPYFLFDDGSAELRSRLRGLMAAHLPPGWQGPFTKDPNDLAISNAFCRVLADEGLLVPEWPREYGGSEMPLELGIIIREEMWAHSEPRGGQYYGPNWIGPSIMQHGTDEQKALHLPAITRGEAIWCQGFSEPDAGSDLASLRTRAEPDGDGFRITGQKVWTSWAGWADWCYLLARVPVDSDNPRDGVTVFLIPMNRDGIEVRPIDGLPGPHHLNEVFFDNVRAERHEVLGTVGGGWSVVRDALSHERVGIARYARSDRVLALVRPDVEARVSSTLRSRWLQARIVNRVSRLANRRTLQTQAVDGAQDFEANAARLITVRADQTVADVASDALGSEFFPDRYTDGAPFGGMVEFFWRYSQGATIASGTTEMLQQRLVSALKRGHRLDAPAGTEDLTEALSELLGGVDRLPALRTAIAEPGTRQRLFANTMAMIEGLDPRDDADSALQAAEVARAAGRSAAPLPIEAMIMAANGGSPVVWSDRTGAIEHPDLFASWQLLRLGESPARATYPAELLGTNTGRFLNRHHPTVTDDPGVSDPLTEALALALPASSLLGAAETALDLATRYAQERVQFGTPIFERQAVSFRLADALSELFGLQNLIQFTLWRIHQDPTTAMSDAWALRWYAVDVVRRSLRTCHQVHGAIGLTYEHDLALITAALQPRLRLPLPEAETLDAFSASVSRDGFTSIFRPAGEPAPKPKETA